jgi:NAD(P)-dependent dehydrogenase (short-subunit alcohol dehydrogenase family)
MIEFSGTAAVVTGAASGIGRALAQKLAERGCDLALADVDEVGLRAVADGINSKRPTKVLTRRVDVADRSQVEAFANDAIATFPRLCIVINNAGVAMQGQFEELELAQIQWLMGINFWGVVHGTHAFLPHLQRQPWGHIVNISSVFGIIGPPGNCAYAASKFAVRGFSESVRHELAMNNSPVRLSVVHPGGVKTNIARSSQVGANLRDRSGRAEAIDRFEQMARTTPEDAAQRIMRGIERNEPRILVGGDARLIDWLQRLWPAGYWKLITRAGLLVTRTRAVQERSEGEKRGIP